MVAGWEGVMGKADPLVVMTTSMLALAAVPALLTWLSLRRHRKPAADGDAGEKEAATGDEKKPSHYGNLTKEALREYTGKDRSKPLLVGIRGKIYDVTAVSIKVPRRAPGGALPSSRPRAAS